jgi:hypothetical protein
MREFKREARYIVFKLTDLEKYIPSEDSKDFIYSIGDAIAKGRNLDGRPIFNAVVVEQDWPEFEMVWASIERRMTHQVEPEDCGHDEARDQSRKRSKL